MKKLHYLLISLSLLSWPSFFCQATGNLKDAFKAGGFLDTVGGANGAGYDTSKRSIDPIIGNIILLVLSLLGILFLILAIYAGYTWMTAMGEEKRVTKAKDMLQAAVTGLIVIGAAYMITYFVFAKLVQPTLAI